MGRLLQNYHQEGLHSRKGRLLQNHHQDGLYVGRGRYQILMNYEEKVRS